MESLLNIEGRVGTMTPKTKSLREAIKVLSFFVKFEEKPTKENF